MKWYISFSKFPKFFLFLFLNVMILPLTWLEYFIYRKRIKEHQIKYAPIFIIGHWRSGTTLLHQLMSKDDSKCYLNFFQASFPGFFLLAENFLKPLLQSVVDLFKLNIPYFNKIRFNWDFPCEEDTALLNMNSSTSAYWAYLFPNKALDWFSRTLFFENKSKKRQEEWVKDYRYFLKKLSFKNNGKQMILKSPPNTARIKQIIKIFPEAKFIYIHRDPCEVYYSHLKLWKDNIRYFSFQQISNKDLDIVILKTLKKMLARYDQDKFLIPEKNLCEVNYSLLVSEPQELLRLIYIKLALPNFLLAEAQYLASNKCKMSYQSFHYEFDPEKCEEIIKMMNSNK